MHLNLLILPAILIAVPAAPALAQTAMPPHEHQSATISTTLAVTVDGKAVSYTLAALQALPQRTVIAHNGHSNADETYTGVAVSDLLAKAGITLQGEGTQKIYHSYLRATGTDGYFVLYSTSEAEAAMHQGDLIVALTLDGKPLGPEGNFKLVSTEDKRPARWVRNLNAIALTSVP